MSGDVVLASELQRGTYVCLKTRSRLGWLVRLFCRPSPFDHAVLVTGPGVCVQATVRGVKRTPLADFKGCLAVANAAEDMTAQERDAAVAYGLAMAMAQEEYAFGLLPVIAMRKLGFRWQWLLDACNRVDREAVICSELVAEGGSRGGLDWLCGEAEVQLVRPDELAARKPYMRPVAWDL